MDIELDVNKTLEENASYYFENSKKMKKKLKGALEALKKFELEEKNKQEETEEKTKKKKEEQKNYIEKINKKYPWYMKYRWFFTSKNHLVIGGKDANTNEEIIKKRLEKKDLVFHADVNGSPFFILKLEKEEQKNYIEKENEEYKREIQEVIDATASFSRAWKYGLSIVECFFVLPEQVTKKAKAGEYLQKGSFMIYGKKNIFTGILKLYVRTIKIDDNNYIMISPVESKENFIELKPGKMKVSDAAKEIKKYIEKKGIKDITLDEIIKNLPGSVDIKYLKR